jgi:MoaA/NifB/PqqE/SkfB family radical SAM enzyme
MTGGPTMVGRRTASRTGLVPPLPEAVRVEVAAVGDLRCAMCLLGFRPPLNRLTAAMPLALFRCLVDDLPGLRALTLQGIGEPLLAPNLVDMVRYAKGRGIHVSVDTNGSLLYRDRAEELVEVGLDRLRVSLDGADPQGFDAEPEGVHFGPVLENLAGLVAARRAADRGTPGVDVVFVATPRNIAHLPDLVALLGGIGVGRVRVQHLPPLVDRLDPDSVLTREPFGAPPPEPEPAAGRQPATDRPEDGEATQVDPQLAAKLFAEASLAAEEYGLDLCLPEPGAVPPLAGDGPYVTSDGTVRSCCAAAGAVPDDGPAPGRLGDYTFADLWAGHANRLAARRV